MPSPPPLHTQNKMGGREESEGRERGGRRKRERETERYIKKMRGGLRHLNLQAFLASPHVTRSPHPCRFYGKQENKSVLTVSMPSKRGHASPPLFNGQFCEGEKNEDENEVKGEGRGWEGGKSSYQFEESGRSKR